jgi:hypothetical protein
VCEVCRATHKGLYCTDISRSAASGYVAWVQSLKEEHELLMERKEMEAAAQLEEAHRY